MEQIKTGDAEQARGSCSQFLEAIQVSALQISHCPDLYFSISGYMPVSRMQESQVEMLRMASKHEGALPYEYNAGLATTLGDTASESREPQPQD